jgi:hypothetical protein
VKAALLRLLTAGYGTSRQFTATHQFGCNRRHSGHAAKPCAASFRRECKTEMFYWMGRPMPPFSAYAAFLPSARVVVVPRAASVLNSSIVMT